MTIQFTTLTNGLKVVYQKSQTSIPITSVQVFCNVGNAHLPQGFKGAAHFIEHMCFKGTKSHPDFQDIILEYTNFGVEYNGYTTSRFTYYVIKCQDVSLDKCLKYMAEGILDSNFSLKHFKKEEKVVIEENMRNSDNPMHILEVLTTDLLYENTVFQYPPDDISYHEKGFNYKEIVDLYKSTYVPSNMVVSVSSNLPFSKVLAIIKKTHLNRGKLKEVPLINQANALMRTPPLIRGIKYSFKEIKKLNTIFLNISFQTCSQYEDEEKYILNFVGNLLCNSDSSRLMGVLRQKHGLVYGVTANTDYYECGGSFTVSSQFNASSFIHNKKPSVLPVIIQELNRLLKKGVTQKELDICKNNLKGHLLFNMQNIDTQTLYNGTTYILFNNQDTLVPYEKIFQTYYEPITKEKLHECIKKYFTRSRMCVSYVGSNLSPQKLVSKECEKLDNP